MCERRWGVKTQIRKWGNGCIRFKCLYNCLEKWDNLVGFWRRIGQVIGDLSSPLVFFEWGEYFIVASRVFPYRIGSYEVMKVPFLWMGLSSEGDHVNMAKSLSNSSIINGDAAKTKLYGGEAEDWVPSFDSSHELQEGNENERYSLVNVNFMGRNHIEIEQNYGFSNGKKRLSPARKHVSPSSSGSNIYGGAGSSGEDVGIRSESPPDYLKLELYQHFANRTSPVRRQRKKEKVKASTKKWETEDYVKIVHSSPTLLRPLQGLWKGISENMNLDFYLVSYDDIGGLICRKVGESSEPLSGSTPIFWTSNSRFMDSPFSVEEDDLHSNRVHGHSHFLTRLLYINSCRDLVDGGFLDSSSMPDKVEGRVWQYTDGCFSFGFLCNSSIVDLKPVDFDNHLLDVVELN